MEDDDWDDGDATNLEGLDDLDADLFGGSLKKNASTGKSTSKSESPPKKVQFKAQPSSPNDFDDDDPLAGLLSDDEPDTKKKPHSETDIKQKSGSGNKPAARPLRGRQAKKDHDIDFKDNDLLDGLGFDEISPNSRNMDKNEKSFMSELLGTKDTERKPETASKLKDFTLDEKYKGNKEDSIFGTYSPSSVAGGQKNVGRRSRLGESASVKQSLDVTASSENKSSAMNASRRGAGLDWLGLGDEKLQSPSSSPSRPQSNPRSKSSSLLDDSDAYNPERQTSIPRRPKSSASDWLSLDDDKTTNVDTAPKVVESGDILPSKITRDSSQKDGSDWLDLKRQFEVKSQPDVKPKEDTVNVELTVPHVQNDKVSISVPVPTVKQDIMEIPESVPVQMVTSTAPQIVALDQLKFLHSEITSVQMEKEHLNKALESSQLRHTDELKSMETFYKNQLKSMEEMHKEADLRLRSELENRAKELEFRVSQLEVEKNKQMSISQQKLVEAEQRSKLEVQRLKELQSHALMNMKQEHQDALTRLQRLKEQEIEAITSTQDQARSIQMIMEELEAKTSQLNQLQQKLESQHQENLESRRSILETKERQVKLTEDRLKRLHEEGEEERVRLQQLVMRLEKRLEEQTRDVEEEKWRILQEKGKLDVQRRSLEDERSQFQHKMEVERNRLQQAKELVLQEQKSILVQMAQERQLLAERESQMRKREEEQARHARKQFQEESRVEVDLKVLQQEKVYMDVERQRVQDEMSKLQRERDTLDRERNHLHMEREKLQDLGIKMKKRSEEIEEMCLSSIQTREEGQNSLAAAKQLEAAFASKRDKMGEQLQSLRLKERQIIMERQFLVEEQQRLEANRNSLLCANCHLSFSRPLSVAPPLMPVAQNDAQKEGHISSLVNHVFHEPSFTIWKLMAEKDKQFLEEESLYLDSLKQNVYSYK